MDSQKFLFDRDAKGSPLELVVAQDLHRRGIPFGFNPFTGTDDPRREDYDLYTGMPEAATLWEVKMDWQSGLTGNVFIEEKTLRNTKAHKLLVGRLILDTFDVSRLREMYNARASVQRGDGTFAQQYRYKHVVGGDQAGNRGMLLDWKACRENGQPYWLTTRQLTRTVQ